MASRNEEKVKNNAKNSLTYSNRERVRKQKRERKRRNLSSKSKMKKNGNVAIEMSKKDSKE